jgi:hypothetical protein
MAKYLDEMTVSISSRMIRCSVAKDGPGIRVLVRRQVGQRPALGERHQRCRPAPSSCSYSRSGCMRRMVHSSATSDAHAVLAVCSSQNDDMSPERNSITLPARLAVVAVQRAHLRLQRVEQPAQLQEQHRRRLLIVRLGGTNPSSSSNPPAEARRRRSKGSRCT